LRRIISISIILILGCFNDNFTQQDSLIQFLKSNLKKNYFNVGLYLQSLGDYQWERNLSSNNGFSVTNARIILNGDIEKFNYYFQTNFVRSKPLLDMKISYKFSPLFILDIGQFKAPFGGEFLISSSSIDFIYRSQATNYIVPNRQIGVRLFGNFSNKNFRYDVGIFNGNGINDNTNNDNNFLYVSRIYFNKTNLEGKNYFSGGFNFAFSKERDTKFNGDKFLIGYDFRLVLNKLFLSSEFILQKLDTINTNEKTSYGYHITSGYFFNRKVHLFIRWDSYIFDDELSIKNNFCVLGMNYLPNELFKFKINYVIKTNESKLKFNQLLFVSQLYF